MAGAADSDPEEIELRLLLEAVFLRYGYDFRRYAPSTLRRRLSHLVARSGLATISELQHLILRDRAAFQGLLDELTIQVTEMFRDPPFYAVFRRDVVPFLRTYAALKIWVAGCASGEEAHSIAIVLHEEGLYARSIIYATDLSSLALQRARAGIYPAEQIKRYAENYRQAQGSCSFTGYFTVAHGYAALDPSLTANLHFAEHNLVSDEVFGEMNAVFCRNVLIYFDRQLQDAALGLLRRSLIRGGFLCLGTQESLRLSAHAEAFEELAPGSKIFRKRIEPGEAR